MTQSPNVFAKMNGWQVVEVRGPEAREFLNRITSANFKTLQTGSFTPATLLSGTGKIVLYFKALAVEPDRYLIVVPRNVPPHDELEKLHFRENLTISQSSEWSYLRVLASDEARIAKLAPAIPEPGKLKVTGDGRIVFNEGRWIAAPVKLDLGILAPLPKAQAIAQVLKASEFDECPELEAYRLRAGAPAVPGELNSTVIPLEAALDEAVHEAKGCYPGQEVIERIRAMGQAPRALARLRGTGPAPELATAGALKIFAEKKDAGIVTSVAADPIEGGWVGLGYIKRVFVDPEASYTVGAAAGTETQPVTVELK